MNIIPTYSTVQCYPKYHCNFPTVSARNVPEAEYYVWKGNDTVYGTPNRNGDAKNASINMQGTKIAFECKFAFDFHFPIHYYSYSVYREWQY